MTVVLLYSAVLALLILFSSYDEYGKQHLWGKRWLVEIFAVLFITAGVFVLDLLSNSSRQVFILAGVSAGILVPFVWRVWRVKNSKSGIHSSLRLLLGLFAAAAVLFALFLLL